MKRYVSFVAVVVLLLLAASCGGQATVTVTQAPPSQTPGEVAGVTPTPTPTPEPPVTPTETPAPPPAEDTGPDITPTVPVNGPDIKPYAIDGTSSIMIENQVTDYKDIKIKAGVTNAGNAPVTDVVVTLRKGAVTLHEWTLEKMEASEEVVLEVTIGEILETKSFSAGVTDLVINCEVQMEELDISNNRVTEKDLVIALPPAPRRATDKTIQEAIDNSTWYTESNKQELIDIAKEILKGIFPYWTSMQIYILPYDEYNDLFTDKHDNVPASSNRITGNLFFEGYINGASIYIREGTLIQILPDLIDALGILFYAQKNYSGYSIGRSINADQLAGYLLESYCIAFMRENYGLDGLINMSVALDVSSYPGVNAFNTNLMMLWAIAADKGYPEGGVPSQTFLEAFNYFTGLSDPNPYIQDLAGKIMLLDTAKINSTLSWRMVDKELTALPLDAVKKIDPGKNSLSLDLVIASQSFVDYPW